MVQPSAQRIHEERQMHPDARRKLARSRLYGVCSVLGIDCSVRNDDLRIDHHNDGIRYSFPHPNLLGMCVFVDLDNGFSHLRFWVADKDTSDNSYAVRGSELTLTAYNLSVAKELEISPTLPMLYQPHVTLGDITTEGDDVFLVVSHFDQDQQEMLYQGCPSGLVSVDPSQYTFIHEAGEEPSYVYIGPEVQIAPEIVPFSDLYQAIVLDAQI